MWIVGFLLVFNSIVSGESVTAESSLSREQIQGDLLPDVQVIDFSDVEENAVESVISKRKLELKAANSVADIVDEIAGLDNLGGPRKEAQKINIRGLQGGQVLQTIDGARQNFQMSHNAVNPVRFHLLESIEVDKGFQMDRGNGALGGHVGYKTADAFRFHRGQNGSVRIGTRGSSVDQLTQGSVTGGQVWGRHAVLIDYTESSSEDIELSDGQPLDYSGSSDRSLMLKYQNRQRLQDIELTVDRFEKNSETPFNPAAGVFSARQVAEQIEVKSAVNFGLKRNDGMKPELRVYANETVMEKTRQTDRRLDRRRVLTTAAEFKGEHTSDYESWALRKQAGMELQRDINSGERNSGALASFPNGDASSVGIYSDNHLSIGSHWLGFGARWDQSEFSSGGLPTYGRVSRLETKVSPKVEYGKFFLDDQLELQVGYNEGFNFPRMQYMFVDGLHFSDGFFENYFVPNVDLRSEHSQEYHVTLKWDYSSHFGDRAMLEVTEYSNLVHDYIDQEIRIADDETQFVNRQKILFRGRELSNTNFVGKWQLITTYHQIRGENVVSGQPLSQTPSDRWTLAVARQETDRWLYGVSSQWVARQDRIDQTQLANVPETPAYDLQNAFVRYRFLNKEDIGSVQLRVNNLLNVQYRPHGTPLEGPARDVRLDFSYHFM